MKPLGLTRSALFVPGNQAERIDKAVATLADMVIIDLEDAVAVLEKESARSIVESKLEQHRQKKLMVRVNAIDTGLIEFDLDCIVRPGLDAIMLPKVQTAEDVLHIGKLIFSAEKKAKISPGRIGIVALIETALGVRNVFAIAATETDPQRLHTLAFGAADFSLDMGVRMSKSGEELSYARARISLSCHAAGIEPPLDTPFMIDLKDRKAFEADAMRGKQVGFGGKLCIHPNQVDFCNQLFSPTEEEITFANKVVTAFDAAEASGTAAIQVDGKFIDYPVVAQSRRILEAAQKIGEMAYTIT